MSWIAQPFPPGLAFGIQCDPMWQTNIITTRSGFESRNQDWSSARHSYDAAFAIRTADDHEIIRAHFHMARGSFHSWPLKDPLDHLVSTDEGVVAATGAAGVFQLFKRYGSGAFAYDRKITRPSVVAIYSDDVLKTEGVDYSIDLDTGVLTYAGGDPALILWEGRFNTPCRYATDKLPVQIVNRQHGGGQLLVSSSGIPIVEVRE